MVCWIAPPAKDQYDCAEPFVHPSRPAPMPAASVVADPPQPVLTWRQPTHRAPLFHHHLIVLGYKALLLRRRQGRYVALFVVAPAHRRVAVMTTQDGFSCWFASERCLRRWPSSSAFACGLTAFLPAFTAFACGSTAFVRATIIVEHVSGIGAAHLPHW